MEEEVQAEKQARYPNLREEDIKKVDKAFEKLFTPLFNSHRQFLSEKVLPSAGSVFIQGYTKDIISEVNECVLNYVVSGVFQKP